MGRLVANLVLLALGGWRVSSYLDMFSEVSTEVLAVQFSGLFEGYQGTGW